MLLKTNKDILVMRKLSIEEIKKIEFEILTKVAEFCDKHGLFYCLAYGTLLGAIRHKGFIPWDDDVDIVMPRKDYDYLIENFNSEMEQQGYFAIAPGSGNHSILKIGKLGTIKYEPEYGNKGGFIDIDVFPLDGVPSNEKEYDKFYDKLIYLYRAHFYQYLNYKNYKFKEKLKTFIKKCLWGCYLGKNRFLKKAKIEHQKYLYETSEYVAAVECLWNSKKNRTKKENYEDRVLVDFEAAKFYAPKGYHEILTGLYGDYMQLPPEEKRVAEHGITAYIKE